MRISIRTVSLSVICFCMAGAGAVVLADQAGPIRLACVGDSITAGAGTMNRETQSYPAQLGRMLGEKWHVDNFGVGGATLLKHGDKPYWNLPAFTNALASDPHVVVIMLGTNDSKPRNWRFKDEFVADYKDLIAQFEKLPSKPVVFVCRPPYVSGTNAFGISNDGVASEIPMIDVAAKQTGAIIIDNYMVFVRSPALLPDHVHPNEEGAAALARSVYLAVRETK